MSTTPASFLNYVTGGAHDLNCVESPISTELHVLSRLSNLSSNPSIVGLAEVVLDSKGDHTRPVNNWLYLWLKFYLKFEIFYAPKFRLEKIYKLLAELLA